LHDVVVSVRQILPQNFPLVNRKMSKL
jgi:hypothetical protein